MPRRRSSNSSVGSRKSNESKKANKRSKKDKIKEELNKQQEVQLKEYLAEKKKYFEDVDNFELDTVIQDNSKKIEEMVFEEESSLSFDRPSVTGFINSFAPRESISIIPRVAEEDQERSDESFINRADLQLVIQKDLALTEKELEYVTQK